MLFLRGKGLIDGFRSWNTRLFLQDERFYKEKIISERSVNLHLEDDEETQRRLSKLEKFAREELESVPLIREKLCLLVSSLPAHEICTSHMQVRMPTNRQLGFETQISSGL